MSKVEKLSVALTPYLAQTVRQAVDGGGYASTSEVVREALREWSDRRAGPSDAELVRAWHEGLASGPPRPLEPKEAFLRRNLARLAALRDHDR
ncbi:type II toxin-antitoxin system ParD family antitoxin [Caulobacter sp. SLTY]|nr:type II toxin-antitoxin system ParD family antitoxin [Caulobacter sp. SLTY]